MPFTSNVRTLAPDGIERRRYPRVSVTARARISKTDGPAEELELCDLSAGGAFLTGGDAPAVGATLEIEITSGPLSGVRLRAEVVHCTAVRGRTGMGVKFCDAESRVAQLIQSVVLAELAVGDGDSEVGAVGIEPTTSTV